MTGFGPFGTTTENPSAWLAERSERPHRVLPVTFSAVEAALDELERTEWDALLLLGLASKSPVMRFETVAHNAIGPHADMDGVVAGPGLIDPKAPSQLHATLWAGLGAETETSARCATVDAGGYLCNYILFRALQRYPDRPVGFLHVAEPDFMPLEVQLSSLRHILERIASRRTETGWTQWLECRPVEGR